MPLYIVRHDITKMECDAIVNAANKSLLGGGGVDGCIHRAAGPKLFDECLTLGGCKTGEAKITKGYNLPAKYVIHTVGPVWDGGTNGEKALLESCYKKSLELAKAHGCTSVAFPLISSGVYGYPKDKALSVAVSIISRFVLENDMTVYIVVFDKNSYKISKELMEDVTTYIDDNYADETALRYGYKRRSASLNNLFYEPIEGKASNDISPQTVSIDTKRELIDILSKIDENFAITLFKLIDARGISDVECYKKANVSKQTWYKILNDASYKPSKNTVLSFAIALELSLVETEKLLATVGFTLSKSSKFDLIIEYFIVKGCYDIFVINETLVAFDQPCLGI